MQRQQASSFRFMNEKFDKSWAARAQLHLVGPQPDSIYRTRTMLHINYKRLLGRAHILVPASKKPIIMSSSTQTDAMASTNTLATLVAVQKDGECYRLSNIKSEADLYSRTKPEEAQANKKDTIGRNSTSRPE